MALQDRIRGDLKDAMKAKDEARKESIRVIMGEFARGEKKTLSDDEVIRILRKLQKSEVEVLQQQGETNSVFLSVIESYLPDMASEAEIREWIAANVDFSQFKNKMQAMRPIMEHFGTRADGNAVKQILQDL